VFFYAAFNHPAPNGWRPLASIDGAFVNAAYTTVYLLYPKAFTPERHIFIPSYSKKLTGAIIALTNNAPRAIILVSDR
jgi:hypothetical protein